MKKNSEKKRSLWKLTICVLIACGIVGTVISGIIFKTNPSRTSASATIEFSFDGAATGTAPNGYVFNVNDITSDEVLNAALESAGMSDRYTVDQIREQLNAQGVYPEDIVNQMTSYESALDFSASRTVTASNYHPSQYAVILYSDFDKAISKGDLQKLLECILKEYKAYFAKTYAIGTNEVSLQISLNDYDYSQQLTILTSLIQESATYAEELYEKKAALKLNGKDFNSIAGQLNNLINTDILKLNASISNNKASKDLDRLIVHYQYEIDQLKAQIENKNKQLGRLDKLISNYEKNGIIYLSTGTAVTKIDGNTNNVYDKLIVARNAVADDIASYKANINTYQLPLNTLIGDNAKTKDASNGSETEENTSEKSITEPTQATTGASDAQIAALEAGINTLIAKRESIMKDFAALIQLYNDEQINDGTVAISSVLYTTPSLISVPFIVQTVKVAGTLCLIGFMVCAVLFIIRNRKEEKAK